MNEEGTPSSNTVILFFNKTKMIMKKVFFILAILASSVMAFSQSSKSKVTYNIGASAGAVVGKYKEAYGSTAGIFFETRCKPYDKVSFTSTVGYNRFLGKGSAGDFGQIPVMGGVMYDLKDDWHVGVQGGVSFYDGGNTDIDFMYAPYVGYSFKKVTVDAKFTSIAVPTTPINTIGISISYRL